VRNRVGHGAVHAGQRGRAGGVIEIDKPGAAAVDQRHPCDGINELRQGISRMSSWGRLSGTGGAGVSDRAAVEGCGTHPSEERARLFCTKVIHLVGIVPPVRPDDPRETHMP
jgi:hypothetical protein